MKRRGGWFTHLQRFLLFKLTPLGRQAVFIMFLSAIGLITVEIPIYQVFCGIVVLFGMAELTGTLVRPRLRVSGALPERVSAGERAEGRLTVENLGYFPAWDVMCGCFGLPAGLRHTDADAVIRVLRRGGVATLPVTFQADRRGEYLLPDISVHSTFPLNLMRFWSAVVPTRTLTVVPAFHRLEHLTMPMTHRYQQGGVLVDTRSGSALEYVGNREYIPGEPTRRLDFRAWARVGKPVVREYQDEFCPHASLVLDTQIAWRSWLDRTDPAVNVEAAISMAASVADSLNQMEATFDLFAAGPDLYLFHTAARGVTHFDSILEILAAVAPTRQNPFEELSPALSESLETTSLVVCLFVDWDASRAELVDRIQQSGCALLVLLIREEPPAEPFPDEDFYSQVSPAQVMSGEVTTL